MVADAPRLAACALGAMFLGTSYPVAGQNSADRRSIVVLREECAAVANRAEVTLFANGTVRLREGLPGHEMLALLELGHAEADALREMLHAIDWQEVRVEAEGPEGDTMVRCRLEIEGVDLALRTVEYGLFDSGSLELNRARQVAARLLSESRERARSGTIPSSYRPRLGDLLERRDGVLFEIVGETSDGRALELTGVEQPYSIYVDRSLIREEFLRVVEREDAP